MLVCESVGPGLADHRTPPSYGEPTDSASNLGVEDRLSVQCTVSLYLPSWGAFLFAAPTNTDCLLTYSLPRRLCPGIYVLFYFFFRFLVFWAFEPLAFTLLSHPLHTPLVIVLRTGRGRVLYPGTPGLLFTSYSIRLIFPSYSLISNWRCLLLTNFSTWRLPNWLDFSTWRLFT